MKSLIYTLLGAITILISYSCAGPDWLDPKPLSFYAPDNVYIDEGGFESLIVTMRKDLNSEHYETRSPMSNEYRMSDLAVCGALSDQIPKDFPLRVTPAGDGGLVNFHSKLFNLAYNSIRNANVLISRIDLVDWEDIEVRNRLLAKGYFYRAYWYYRLVNSYGDVPYIGEEIKGPKLDFFTYSRWAILKKIEEDMVWAVQHLPVSDEPGATTKGAGNHLLTKIALANSHFDLAVTASSEVINGPYELISERFGSVANDPKRNFIWDLHRPENISIAANTETILAVVDRFEAPDEAKEFTWYGTIYHPSWWHSRVRDSEGKPGMIAGGPAYDTLFRGNGLVRPTPYYLYEMWDYENDIRRSDINWIEWYELKYNNPASVDFGKPVNKSYFASPIDTFQQIYSFPYYKTFVPDQIPVTHPRGSYGDAYIFRLAGTYLLRAEAYFWKGDLVQAANNINMVRQRSGALPVSPDEVNIDLIFDERARELFIEEPRHGEMIRVSYIMAQANMNGYSLQNFSDENWFYDRTLAKNFFYQIDYSWGPQTYRIAPHNALWPIPESVIAANTLGQINQNMGYAGSENNQTPIEIIE